MAPAIDRERPRRLRDAEPAHLAIAAGLFDRLVEVLRRTPEPYDRYLAAGIEASPGGLLAAGLLLFANNLVISHGQRLL